MSVNNDVVTEDLDDFFQVQTLEPARTAVLPNLRAIDAGFVLTWTETPVEGQPYHRSGMVLSLAPRACSVWVQPDDARPGEGFAVVVDDVTEADWSGARRQVGTARDYLSTAAWQRPRQLPRAWLRTDTVEAGDFAASRTYVHADALCPPMAVPGGQPVVWGEPRAGRGVRVPAVAASDVGAADGRVGAGSGVRTVPAGGPPAVGVCGCRRERTRPRRA